MTKRIIKRKHYVSSPGIKFKNDTTWNPTIISKKWKIHVTFSYPYTKQGHKYSKINKAKLTSSYWVNPQKSYEGIENSSIIEAFHIETTVLFALQ